MRAKAIPIVTAPPERVWVWSDLHLSDRVALAAWSRPFRDTDEMNHHLLREWSRQVRTGDTIICLGDVAHPDMWRNRRIGLDLRNCPGERLLVLGNHDVDPINQVHWVEVHRTAVTLVAPGDPPALLTHVPLLLVPAGCVNVHGHLHQKESPSRNRHINVSVEQLNYRPAQLSDIRRLARRLLEGRTVPGHSTGACLNIVERIMP